MPFSAIPLVGSRNCQPRCSQEDCQILASPPSSTSRGALGVCAAHARAAMSSAQATRDPSMHQARVDTFSKFFNLFGLLQAGYGKHVTIVLLQLLFQFLRQLHDLGYFLQIPFMVGL